MEKVKKGADRPENRRTGGGPDDGGRSPDLRDQYRGAAPRERGGDQPCGGHDPEDLQCVRDPAEPYFLDRVVYHRDAGDEGAEVDHADAKNFKLRDGYVEAGPAE